MFRLKSSVVAALTLIAISASTASAAVYDAGSDPTGTPYGGAVSSPEYVDFQVSTKSFVQSIATLSGKGSGTLYIYACTSNCTGPGVPGVGALEDSILLSGASIQSGLLTDELKSGNYFGELVVSHPSRGAVEAVSISVSAIPEPATWALMLLGFMGVGFMSYRRKGSATFRIA